LRLKLSSGSFFIKLFIFNSTDFKRLSADQQLTYRLSKQLSYSSYKLANLDTEIADYQTPNKQTLLLEQNYLQNLPRRMKLNL
jgi:hypothetical protein